MARKTHHIVPNPDSGWDIKKGGGERSIKHFNKKQDTADFGRNVSKNQGSEFIIHKKDGTIQNSDSHGNNPCSPKDKKGVSYDEIK